MSEIADVLSNVSYCFGGDGLLLSVELRPLTGQLSVTQMIFMRDYEAAAELH
jgi:hypothetical protein